MSYASAQTTYREHLTVRDCGIYMLSLSGMSLNYVLFPIYVSTDLNKVYASSGSITASDGIYGIEGRGTISSIDVNNTDAGWLIFPNYGLIVYDGSTNMRLNYYNKTLTPKYVVSTDNLTADSCKVYYKGIEQTYSDY